jgi:hypothetical protein
MSKRTAQILATGTLTSLALTGVGTAQAVEVSSNAVAVPSADNPERLTAAALVKSGPSEWTGKKLRHPQGGRFSPNVERWANLVLLVMAEKNIPKKRLPGILAQIQQESSGNPKAVNRWDSNAKRGTPSKGLLQVIKPTYRTYAKPGYRKPKYMTVPYTNIYAALSYVKDTYGMKKFASWNRGHNQGY